MKQKMIILITLLFCTGFLAQIHANDCDIYIPELPAIHIESIQPLIPKSFVDIIIIQENGDSIVQPGYLADKDGRLITRRSTLINATEVYIQTPDSTYQVIPETIALNAIGDMILLKVEKPDMKIDPLKIRYDPPEKHETVAVISSGGYSSETISTMEVTGIPVDPFLSHICVLDSSPDNSFAGAFAVNYEGYILGIIKSVQSDSLYTNYLISFTPVFEDGPRSHSRDLITQFSEPIFVSEQVKFDQALDKYWNSEYENARNYFLDVILSIDANPIVLLYSAYSEFFLGEVNNAIGKADEIIELGHHISETYILKSSVYEMIDKPDEARVAIDSALALNPISTNALFISAHLYFSKGKYFKAGKVIDIIEQNHKSNARVLTAHALNNLYYNRYEKACDLFQEALNIYQSNTMLYIYVANMYLSFNDKEKAMKFTRKALEIDPEDGSIHFFLANYYHEENMIDSAITAYRATVEYAPYFFDARYNLGMVLVRAERFSEAIEHFEKAKEIYPEDYKLMRSLGACYAHEKRFDDAVKTFKRVLSLAPKSQITHYNLGLVYFEMNKYDAALQHFDSAFTLGYRNRALFYQRGKLNIARGDTLSAEIDLEFLKLISTKTARQLNNIIMGHEEEPIDSTQEMVYKQLIDNLETTLVNITAYYNYFFSRKFRSSLFKVTRYGHIGWGLVLNNRGDIISVALQFEGADKAYFSRHKATRGELKFKHYTKNLSMPQLNKTKTKMIGDDYIVFSSKLKDTTVSVTPRASDYPEIDDSLLIYTDPLTEYSDHFVGKVRAVNSDPVMGRIIVMETPYGMERKVGIVMNMQGEVVGFLSSITVPDFNFCFVHPINDLCHFYSTYNRDVQDFSYDLEKLDSMNVNLAIGKIYLWLGNLESALESFHLAEKENPKNEEIGVYCCYTAWKLGNTDKAIGSLQKLYKKKSRCFEAYYLLGQIYKSQINNEEAVRMFKKAIKYNPKFIMARYELAKLYIIMGKPDKATEEYEKVKKIDPVLAQKILG
jgi:tetratricopeptide (TPR) repeat protein